MALVLPFRPPSKSMPRRDVIAFCERLLERAQAGEVQGVVCILAIADAEDELSISGEFAENLDYAASAARASLGCFLDREENQRDAMLATLNEAEDLAVLKAADGIPMQRLG